MIYAPLTYAEVIGDPIAQSKSPAIHGFWLSKVGIAADYRACHVRADGLADYVSRRRADTDWRGCNVTMPHKQAVMPLLDGLSDEAQRIGAVNTVVREGERLIGYNTDAAGFIEPLLPQLGDEPDRFAYLIGTGGAARAIAEALYEADFLTFSLSRNPAKAKADLGQWLGEDEDFYIALDHLRDGDPQPADPEAFTVIVNATPLGMVGHGPLALGWAGFRGNAIAYDIVTTPLDTAFLQAARGFGMECIDGLAMLIGQAAVAFEKFFGQPAPREYDDELRAVLTGGTE